MKRTKKASEIFHSVDPALNVIDRGKRKLRKKDWERAGGAVCPRCNQEAMRFRPQDGVCIPCAQELNLKQDRDDKKRDKQRKFIKQHNARIDRKKRAAK